MYRTRPKPSVKPVLNKQAQEVQETLNRIMNLSALVRRSQIASGLGMSYDNKRDLYAALGYKQELVYDDYVNISSREGLGCRVNEAPCDAVWRTPPRVFDVGDEDKSKFEKAWDAIVKRTKLWSKFNRADKLLGFGDYSIVLMGFDDVSDQSMMAQPVSDDVELLYLQTYASNYVQIKKLQDDPSDERYGQPDLYEIMVADLPAIEGSTKVVRNMVVHWTRILHILEGNLQNEVFGEPRLKKSYNRLQDIQKICGGSGEMYWRGAKPGQMFQLNADAQWDENDPSVVKMKEQLDEYEHNLRRILLLQGVDVKDLGGSAGVSSPESHMNVQIQDLAAGARIPKRFLTGSEMGELASSQDRDNWMDYVEERRSWFAEPIVLGPFLDRLIQYGALPTPENEYRIDWPDLRTPSEQDKAQVGSTRAGALNTYLSAPGADSLFPPEAFLRYCLGLNDEAIQDVMEWYQEQQDLEESDMQDAEDQATQDQQDADDQGDGVEGQNNPEEQSTNPGEKKQVPVSPPSVKGKRKKVSLKEGV